MNIILATYHLGLVLTVWIFYRAAHKTKPDTAGLVALIFAVVWPVTLPYMVSMAIIQVRRERKKK